MIASYLNHVFRHAWCETLAGKREETEISPVRGQTDLDLAVRMNRMSDEALSHVVIVQCPALLARMLHVGVHVCLHSVLPIQDTCTGYFRTGNRKNLQHCLSSALFIPLWRGFSSKHECRRVHSCNLTYNPLTFVTVKQWEMSFNAASSTPGYGILSTTHAHTLTIMFCSGSNTPIMLILRFSLIPQAKMSSQRIHLEGQGKTFVLNVTSAYKATARGFPCLHPVRTPAQVQEQSLP